VILRPYQLRAIRSVRDARLAGQRSILLVSPTGSGKTVLLATMTRQAVDQGKRVAWFVNRRELVTQSGATLERFGLAVGANGTGLTAPVQVGTYQGAVAGGEVPPADVVMFDEAHHLSDKGEWLSIAKAYPGAVVIGATATPERGDGRGLDHLFAHLIVVAQASELVDIWRATGGKSGLVPCEVMRPNRPLPAGSISRTPAQATLLHKLRDHQQVVFAPHILAAERFCAEFAECGISAKVVTGKTPSDERDDILARFARREIRVLVNVHVLTEGWDAPAVEVITLARRFQTIGAMIQATGRGARPLPNKSRFLVLDLCGVTHELGHPFMDRTFSLTGEGISGPAIERIRLNLCKRCQQEMPEDSNTCATPGCGWTRPAPEVPKSVNERLEKWEFRRRDDDDDRVRNMVRWIRAAQHRGSRQKAMAIAIHTYQGFYHEKEVPRAIISHAAAIAAGRGWCPRCSHSVRDGACRCTRAA
jgi:superfamily II DNA or RNA helicase